MHTVKEMDLSLLKNAALSKMLNKIEDVIKSAYGNETCSIAVPFLEASQAYELALGGCDLQKTESLQDADETADAAWKALEGQLRASLHHPNEKKREAAEKIAEKFSEFSDPTRLNYEEEYALVGSLLEILRSFPAQTLKLAYIHEYVDALEESHNHFLEVYRDAREGTRIPQLCKKARQEAVDAFVQFRETLNVMARISSEPRIVQIIEGINALKK